MDATGSQVNTNDVTVTNDNNRRGGDDEQTGDSLQRQDSIVGIIFDDEVTNSIVGVLVEDDTVSTTLDSFIDEAVNNPGIELMSDSQAATALNSMMADSPERAMVDYLASDNDYMELVMGNVRRELLNATSRNAEPSPNPSTATSRQPHRLQQVRRHRQRVRYTPTRRRPWVRIENTPTRVNHAPIGVEAMEVDHEEEVRSMTPVDHVEMIASSGDGSYIASLSATTTSDGTRMDRSPSDVSVADTTPLMTPASTVTTPSETPALSETTPVVTPTLTSETTPTVPASSIVNIVLNLTSISEMASIEDTLLANTPIRASASNISNASTISYIIIDTPILSDTTIPAAPPRSLTHSPTSMESSPIVRSPTTNQTTTTTNITRQRGREVRRASRIPRRSPGHRRARDSLTDDEDDDILSRELRPRNYPELRRR